MAWIPKEKAEKEAVWAYVEDLMVRGLGRDLALERVCQEYDVTLEMVLSCEPRRRDGERRRGKDTHVQDIGRALRDGGVEVGACEGEGEGDVVDVDGILAGMEREEVAALWERIGGEVLRCFFVKILGELPDRKWVAKTRWVSVLGEEGVVCHAPGVVVDERGARQVVPKGAISILAEDGGVRRVLLNARRKYLDLSRKRPLLRYYQYELGAGDWEYHLRTFVANASLFAGDVVGHLTGTAIGELFGVGRAAVSLQRRKIADGYVERTGGRLCFRGLHKTKDPRKGKRKGEGGGRR